METAVWEAFSAAASAMSALGAGLTKGRQESGLHSDRGENRLPHRESISNEVFALQKIEDGMRQTGGSKCRELLQ